jgi:hypothetical protein
MEPSEIFILSLVSLFISIVAYSINKAFNSKCLNFSCCFGLIKFSRDVKEENKLDIEKINHNINLNDDNNILNENINKIINNNNE